MSKPVWEIEPHYCSDFDVLDVDDLDAWDQLIQVVEHVYDNMEAGEERTITIRFNGPRPDKETFPEHLRDDAQYKQCDQCGRKSWDRPQLRIPCDLQQPPDGLTCMGVLVPVQNRGGSR